MKTETKKLPYMSYENYVLLQNFIDIQIENTHARAVDALVFIPTGTTYQTTRDYVWEVCRKEQAKFMRMKEELKFAVMSAHRDHPNPAMRKYWGVEEKPLTVTSKPV